jgi:hypothetical protein
VPNPDAQAKLIRRTYQDAGLDFARTGYFEAHVNQPPLCPQKLKQLILTISPGHWHFGG